jgi:hypothetical protein
VVEDFDGKSIQREIIRAISSESGWKDTGRSVRW